MAAGRRDSAVEHGPPACVIKECLARRRRAEPPGEGSFGIFEHMDSRDRTGTMPEIGPHPSGRLMDRPIEEHVRVDLLPCVSQDDCELSNAGPGAGTIWMSKHDQRCPSFPRLHWRARRPV